MVVVKHFILVRPLNCHIKVPVVLVCLEFEIEFFVIDDKLDQTISVICKEIHAWFQLTFTFENKLSFTVVECGITDVAILSTIVANVNHRIGSTSIWRVIL